MNFSIWIFPEWMMCVYVKKIYAKHAINMIEICLSWGAHNNYVGLNPSIILLSIQSHLCPNLYSKVIVVSSLLTQYMWNLKKIDLLKQLHIYPNRRMAYHYENLKTLSPPCLPDVELNSTSGRVRWWILGLKHIFPK